MCEFIVGKNFTVFVVVVVVVVVSAMKDLGQSRFEDFHRCI